MGMNPLTNRLDNHFLEILSITAMFFLWNCKLQKKRPSYSGLLNEIFFEIDKLKKISSKLREAMNINLTLCRDWNTEAGFRR
jgi:hypothetical protein